MCPHFSIPLYPCILKRGIYLIFFFSKQKIGRFEDRIKTNAKYSKRYIFYHNPPYSGKQSRLAWRVERLIRSNTPSRTFHFRIDSEATVSRNADTRSTKPNFNFACWSHRVLSLSFIAKKRKKKKRGNGRSVYEQEVMRSRRSFGSYSRVLVFSKLKIRVGKKKGARKVARKGAKPRVPAEPRLNNSLVCREDARTVWFFELESVVRPLRPFLERVKLLLE